MFLNDCNAVRTCPCPTKSHLFSLAKRKHYLMHQEHWLVPRYLHWTFRASFSSLIITDFIAFFLISGLWACAIYLGSLVSPRCFVVAGTPLSEMDDWRHNFYFMDAFQLSWTTFSTVVSLERGWSCWFRTRFC